MAVAALLTALATAGTGLPAGAAAPVSVTVGPLRSAPPGLFGLNSNLLQNGPTWTDPRFHSALRGLSPGTLRYPGGTVANYWDWRQDWFQAGTGWPGQTDEDNGQPIRKFDYSVEAFASAVRATGARAVFVLNPLTVDGRIAGDADNARMLADQIAFLRSAAAAGVPVDRVELGNEFYLTGGEHGPHVDDYPKRFVTAGHYARQMRVWTDAIHREFPAAEVGAVGADATGHNRPRREGWNTGVLAEIDSIDALTIHSYFPQHDPTVAPQALLALPYARFASLQGSELRQLRERGKQAWVTEFNMIDRTRELRFAGTWAHGLVDATYAVLLAQDPAVGYIGLHNSVGNAKAGALFDNARGFSADRPVTTPMTHTAVGSAIAPVMTAAKGARTVSTLRFPGGPQLPGGAPALVGLGFTGGGAEQAVLLNLAAAPVTLDVRALLPGGFRTESSRAGSLAVRVHSGDVSVTRGAGSGTVTLAPHSVVRLTAG